MQAKLNLKALLSLEQAAEYLTSISTQRVSIQDVLQLVLDKRLPLSVKFVKPVKVCPGKIVRYTPQEIDQLVSSKDYVDDLNWVDDLLVVFVPEKDGRPSDAPRPKIMCSHYLGEDRWITFDDVVTTVTGVWDLPMIGGEVHDVVNLFHALTGSPLVAHDQCDGTFVMRDDAMVCKLLTLDDVPEAPRHGNGRFLEDYNAAQSLPGASVLGIRPEALKVLEATLRKQPAKPVSDELNTRSKRTMQTVIAALCNRLGIDWNAPGSARKIEELTELLDAKVAEQTIKQAILEGMDDAIDSRSSLG